jgi:hypothetical protein
MSVNTGKKKHVKIILRETENEMPVRTGGMQKGKGRHS